jgi:hypothetical protein
MKKVILVTLLLAICGALDNSALAQEVPRYLVTYWRSLTNSNIRSATVVTVVNQSLSTDCHVQVEWVSSFNTHAGMSGPLPLPHGEAVHFCSRNLPNIPSCSSGGVSVPALNGAGGQNQGTAIVSSSSEFECGLIAVEARVYYTTGAGATEAVSAISNSKVVFAGDGNLGD